jgi:uncharacterized protein YdhG (YjbR/CyaY superfamily)
MLKISANNIDEFIAAYPPAMQEKLRKMRNTIKKAAPAATEAIKYGIPTFVLNGNLVHFAAYEHHIGFYPAPSGIVEFRKELAPYESAKGSVRFPLDKPLPLALIAQIVKFRVAENMSKKSKLKEVKKTGSPARAAKAQAVAKKRSKKVSPKRAIAKKRRT